MPLKYLALSRRDSEPADLRVASATKNHPRDRWGHPLAKRNVLASLEEIGPDL